MENDRYLGIDIGGTSAKHAIIVQDGTKSFSGRYPTGPKMSREEFMGTLLQVIQVAVKENIRGVGISTLGIVRAETGEILGGVENLPALNGLKLKEILQQNHPQLELAVYNDVKAAALGERWLGAAKGCNNFFTIAMGTGLGGCAFLNGQLVEGANHHAGEIGYWDYRSQSDYCEHRLSTGFVMNRTADLLGLESLNGFEFFTLVRQGNTICQEILKEWAMHIARVVSNIIILLDPEKVIIGGGVSTEDEYLLTPIRQNLQAMLPAAFQNHTEVVMAQCANDAGILGAVSGFFKK